MLVVVCNINIQASLNKEGGIMTYKFIECAER